MSKFSSQETVSSGKEVSPNSPGYNKMTSIQSKIASLKEQHSKRVSKLRNLSVVGGLSASPAPTNNLTQIMSNSGQIDEVEDQDSDADSFFGVESVFGEFLQLSL